jgi:cell division protein FtsZ
MGVLTVAVVTKPFLFEQKKRMSQALRGIEELEKNVDSLILIPNEKLTMVLGEDASLEDCFKAANDVLQNAVQGISDLITCPGLVNVDFADVRTVMLNRGKAMMGLGTGKGENRAMDAVEAALSSPLIEDIELANARGVLINIACDRSLKMKEVQKINQRVMQIASDDVDVKYGTSLDLSLDGELRVTVVATGLGSKVQEQPKVVPMPERKTGTYDAHPMTRTPGNADRPTFQHVRGQATAAAGGGAPDWSNGDMIDIPTFLRNQAD